MISANVFVIVSLNFDATLDPWEIRGYADSVQQAYATVAAFRDQDASPDFVYYILPALSA